MENSLEGLIQRVTTIAKSWNKDVFWNVITRKKILIARISGIQRCLEQYYLRKLVELEMDLKSELEGVLDEEELLWKQKSRREWLSLGDRNTKYFHGLAVRRERANQIKSLRLDDGTQCYDEDRLQHAVVSYYQKLYADDLAFAG